MALVARRSEEPAIDWQPHSQLAAVEDPAGTGPAGGGAGGRLVLSVSQENTSSHAIRS